MKPRVVLVPGLMGSALQDATRPLSQIKQLCAEHWELYPDLKRALEDAGNVLCNDDSDVVWGKVQFVHWLADVKEWLGLLTRGDCYKLPGGIKPKSFTEVEGRLHKKFGRFEFKPYAALSQRLRREGIDLLEFYYDWRLSANEAASNLNDAILAYWFGGSLPPRPLKQSEKVVLIGHSLGGILSRLVVEDPNLNGSQLVRRAILIGTPNKGAPVSYAYFTGTKHFLDDQPAWALIRRLHDEHRQKTKPDMAAVAANSSAAAWKPREIETNMILEDEQRDLVQSLASICQLLPVYDFVEEKNRKLRPWRETFKFDVHKKSREPVLKLLDEVHSVLMDPVSLDAWLSRHGIFYDLLGSTGFRTVTKLKPKPVKSYLYDMLRPKKSGDGTVPTYSALDWVTEVKGIERIKVIKVDPRKQNALHAQLCQHRQVIEHCVAHTKKPPKAGISSVEDPGRMYPGRIEQYMRIAHDIFRSGREPFKYKVPDGRTQVISFALIEGYGPGPLIDTDRTVDMNGNWKLAKRIPGLDSTQRIYKGRSGQLSYEFVLLEPHGESTPGSGVLFLPNDDETFLHVFGIITRRWDSKSCDNDGHAEMRVTTWLNAQKADRSWHGNVARIHLWNENLLQAKRANVKQASPREENLGFSPCAPCCVDLAQMHWPATNNPIKVMHWNTVYPGKEGCANETTNYSLSLMEKAGWQFANSPRPQR